MPRIEFTIEFQNKSVPNLAEIMYLVEEKSGLDFYVVAINEINHIILNNNTNYAHDKSYRFFNIRPIKKLGDVYLDIKSHSIIIEYIPCGFSRPYLLCVVLSVMKAFPGAMVPNYNFKTDVGRWEDLRFAWLRYC